MPIQTLRGIFVAFLAMGAVPAFAWAESDVPSRGPLILVVMDPLSEPLSCDCVQGYAQRKYEVLGKFLEQELRRPVKVYWSESLVTALEEKTRGKVDLVIGKHSVVLHDARQVKRKLKPIAALTDKEGHTTQTGLIVVRKEDPAQTAADLGGYRIFFGPGECDEKSRAPMALLKQLGISLPQRPETYPACSNAATALVELDANVKAAAVISSYAEPLLEGCGTIQKGDLRVVGVTDPVPFITAFVNAKLPEQEIGLIQQALLKVGTDADLLIALETTLGFVEYKPVPPPGSSEKREQNKKDRPSTALKKKN